MGFMELARSQPRPHHKSMDVPDRYTLGRRIEALEIAQSVFVLGDGIVQPIHQMAMSRANKLNRRYSVKRTFERDRLGVRILRTA